MIVETPVGRVTNILADAGYHQLRVPLRIGSIEFDLSAAFIGTSPSPDLILVVDTTTEDEQRILKKVSAIARVLDVMQSKRPLTVVLAGPRPQPTSLDAMSRVCRALPIGLISGGDSDTELRNWLSILMPLRLPESDISIVDPMKEIADQFDRLPDEIIGLLTVAQQGTDAVYKRLIELISEVLEDADVEGDQ